MNKIVTQLMGAVLLAAVAGFVGHWWGTHDAQWHGAPASEDKNAAASAPKERKIRFYRNPMGLADTSSVPKKDSMGMDYIPVYEDEEVDAASNPKVLNISTEKVQKLGVRTEVVSLRSIDKTVRVAGRIEPDERRTYTIAPKFEGYIDKLLVNATGQAVAKGQPLFEAYSQELTATQREYAIAAQGMQTLGQANADVQSGMRQLSDAGLARLRNWDISEEQIRELAASGVAKRTLTFRSPVSGFVSEKKAVQGMRFMPGDALFQVSDLSAVWVVADVFEQDVAGVRLGARAKINVNAYPQKTFTAAVTYIYPTLNPETRTVPVRLELGNPGGMLKPGMFVQVELSTGSTAKVTVVPKSAVIDSGTRQIVLVQASEGRFEPREVRIGTRGDNFWEVLEGLQEGEQVVVSANFLIDAESNLKAAIAGFGAPKSAPVPKAGTSYQARGTVVKVDAKAQTVTISHGAIPSLKWPAMTMDFALSNGGLLRDLHLNEDVAFEFVERGKGDWMITNVTTVGK